MDQIYSLEMNCKTYNAEGLVNFAKMTKVNNWELTHTHTHTVLLHKKLIGPRAKVVHPRV